MLCNILLAESGLSSNADHFLKRLKEAMATLRQSLRRVDWSFGLQWVLATIVGWVIGFTICEDIKVFISSWHFSPDGAIIGISVGIVQYFALSRRLKGVEWWIMAT